MFDKCGYILWCVIWMWIVSDSWFVVNKVYGVNSWECVECV